MHPLGAPLFRVVGKTYEDSVEAWERDMYIGLHDNATGVHAATH